jgi:hypothetical protein
MAVKNLYLYDPEICDGDICIKDCDVCPKKETILSKCPTDECPPGKGDCGGNECEACWKDYLRDRNAQ